MAKFQPHKSLKLHLSTEYIWGTPFLTCRFWSICTLYSRIRSSLQKRELFRSRSFGLRMRDRQIFFFFFPFPPICFLLFLALVFFFSFSFSFFFFFFFFSFSFFPFFLFSFFFIISCLSLSGWCRADIFSPTPCLLTPRYLLPVAGGGDGGGGLEGLRCVTFRTKWFCN